MVQIQFDPPRFGFERRKRALPQECLFLPKSTAEHPASNSRVSAIAREKKISLTEKKNESPCTINNNNTRQKYDKPSTEKLRTIYLHLPIPPKVIEGYLKMRNCVRPANELRKNKQTKPPQMI